MWNSPGYILSSLEDTMVTVTKTNRHTFQFQVPVMVVDRGVAGRRSHTRPGFRSPSLPLSLIHSFGDSGVGCLSGSSARALHVIQNSWQIKYGTSVARSPGWTNFGCTQDFQKVNLDVFLMREKKRVAQMWRHLLNRLSLALFASSTERKEELRVREWDEEQLLTLLHRWHFGAWKL